jgi:hypothetical protein
MIWADPVSAQDGKGTRHLARVSAFHVALSSREDRYDEYPDNTASPLPDTGGPARFQGLESQNWLKNFQTSAGPQVFDDEPLSGNGVWPPLKEQNSVG